MKFSRMLVFGIFTVVILGVFTGLHRCERETSPAAPNQPPTTTITNKPAEGDTMFALVHLTWDGGDPDGYVAGYQWRNTTHYLTRGDSVKTEWNETTASQQTIAFNSEDSLNFQWFEVRSVDNDGAVDPTPATKTFYTPRTFPPEVEILTPNDGQEMFARQEVSDWWHGVELSFDGTDQDGEIVEYGWAIDDGEWHWMEDTTLFITPDQFPGGIDGKHMLRVTARDNTGLMNPGGDTVEVTLVEPDFDRDILIIDETDEDNFPSAVSADDSKVDSFYTAIFGTEYHWDYARNVLRDQPMPARSELGRYKAVVWHADDKPSSSPHALPGHVNILRDYMNVGGNLVMSGFRMLKSFRFNDNFPVTFNSGSFVARYLHIIEANETPVFPSDFIGAAGRAGFSDVEVDSVKLANAFPYYGKLTNVNTITRRAGFTDVIYTYQNTDENQNLLVYRYQPVGLWYHGTVYDAIVLGFPMFFIKEAHAETMATEIVKALNLR